MRDEDLLTQHNSPPSSWPYAFRYGMIAGLSAAIFYLAIYLAGQQYNRSFQWLGMIIPLVLVIMCMNGYKKDAFPRVTGGRAFLTGMQFFLVYAVVVALYTLVLTGVIDPGYTDGLKDIAVDRMEDRGLSDEMIERQMKGMDFMFRTPMMLASGLLFNLITGAVISGIIALFVRAPSTG